MSLDITATTAALAALLVGAIIWHFASGSIAGATGRAGKWVVLAGWVVLIVIGAVILATVVDCSASAQERPRPTGVTDPTSLALARTCYSERDARLDTDDCAAIWETTLNAARLTGRTPLEQMRAQSPEATGTVLARSIRQRWVSSLRADAAEPGGWAALNADRTARSLRPLPWSSTRSAWIATLAEARALVVSPRRVCSQPPRVWGGGCTPDGEPASHLGVCDAPSPNMVRVHCGDTVNHYYRYQRPRAQGARRGTLPASTARGDPR